MNAYELADYVDAREINNPHLKESATMLRQLADRIAELEKEAESCWCQGHSEAYLKAKGRLPNQVSSKPVAWGLWNDSIDGFQETTASEYTASDWKDFLGDNEKIVPLYTHPVKQLSDWDLDKLIKDAEHGGYMEMYIVGLIDGFNHARAIIKEITQCP